MKIIIVIMLVLSTTAVLGEDSKYLTYDEFIRKVDAGQVKTVTLDHLSRFHGTYLVDGEELPFHSYSDVGSASDPLLVRELKNKNIPIEISGRNQDPEIWKNTLPIMLFMWGIPLITLIFVIRISRKLSKIEKAQQSPPPYSSPTTGSKFDET